MILFSEGAKGGTGKSLVSACLLDYLINRGESPILIETDTSTPDVYRAYTKDIKTFATGIDEESEWLDFLALIDENRKSNIVVNSGARNQEAIKKYGSLLKEDELKIEIKTFWTLNPYEDSILLLKNYLNIIPAEDVFVIKNKHFGEDFSTFDASKTAQKIINPILSLPNLTIKQATTFFYTDRIPLHKIPEKLRIGERIFFKKWLNEVRETFNSVLGSE